MKLMNFNKIFRIKRDFVCNSGFLYLGTLTHKDYVMQISQHDAFKTCLTKFGVANILNCYLIEI